jgi:creatinine amidohydrolase/Fe(II)-dependent formamide hydrolase-like protein
MLAIRPDLVTMDRIARDWDMAIAPYDVYPQPPGVIPAAGALSDPSRARAEIGQFLIDRSVDKLVEMVEREFRG